MRLLYLSILTLLLFSCAKEVDQQYSNQQSTTSSNSGGSSGNGYTPEMVTIIGVLKDDSTGALLSGYEISNISGVTPYSRDTTVNGEFTINVYNNLSSYNPSLPVSVPLSINEVNNLNNLITQDLYFGFAQDGDTLYKELLVDMPY